MKVWTTGRDLVTGNNYHTNFKLTQTKDNPEYIYFNKSPRSNIDQQQLQITQKEHSRGRTADGGMDWSIYLNPTPGQFKHNATPYSKYAEKPEMSMAAGFYNVPLLVAYYHYSTQFGNPLHNKWL